MLGFFVSRFYYVVVAFGVRLVELNSNRTILERDIFKQSAWYFAIAFVK